MRLRGVVAASRTTVDDGAAAVTAAATAPNARGELPLPELRYLTNSSFPDGLKKAKGDYNPPQTHLLAASRMFRTFGSGKHISAMAFVLSLRELECVRFQASPAVLMAIFSGRLGSRGLTLMHFKEASEMECLEDGSTNVNFAGDFSAAANLPAVSIKCSTYEDILDAVHRLNAFGQEVWYDHMLIVRLTLLYANKFLGTALGHLQADDPQWWAGFCEALRGIDYQSTAWTMALVGVLTQTAGCSEKYRKFMHQDRDVDPTPDPDQ
ncbi:Hypothetical protein PHPALM_2379 [Phytophthora palmivora]|uniref:Uncharacterized protein n=1 Tax=Phytophthora palmivora TaxID=4796 RepID=A0A2P4YPW1_9STRA|nr:Hypothetical protein PHPALM_2379 [Phytophthora palmivora]